MVPHLVLAWLTSGAAAGFLTSAFLRRWEYGTPGDVTTGAIGGFVGGLFCSHLHLRLGSHATTAIIVGCLSSVAFVAMTRVAYSRRPTNPQ